MIPSATTIPVTQGEIEESTKEAIATNQKTMPPPMEATPAATASQSATKTEPPSKLQNRSLTAR